MILNDNFMILFDLIFYLWILQILNILLHEFVKIDYERIYI